MANEIAGPQPTGPRQLELPSIQVDKTKPKWLEYTKGGYPPNRRLSAFGRDAANSDGIRGERKAVY